MPDQLLMCQFTRSRPCGEAAVYRLHFTLSQGGCQFSGVYCRGCVGLRKDQIRAEGGQIISVEDLAAPAAVAGGE